MKDGSVIAEFEAMMNMPAWKLMEDWAKQEREESMKRMDNKAASDLNINVVCEERGIRIGLRKFLQKAEQMRAGE